MAIDKNETPKTTGEVKDYAGGWITEREGQPIPAFLKVAIPIIALSGAAYLFLYMNGEVSHAERGPFVQQMNRATTSADGLMITITLMVVVFAVIVSLFAFGKTTHKD